MLARIDNKLIESRIAVLETQAAGPAGISTPFCFITCGFHASSCVTKLYMSPCTEYIFFSVGTSTELPMVSIAASFHSDDRSYTAKLLAS